MIMNDHIKNLEESILENLDRLLIIIIKEYFIINGKLFY